MRLCGLRLTLLAAFGAGLVGSGGVLAAPVTCSSCLSPSPRDESGRADPALLVRGEPERHHMHMKREDVEKGPSYQTSYNWTNSPWSAAGIAQHDREDDGPRDKLGGRISDEMYDDIIVTAIMASFTPRDKLAVQTRPAKALDKTLAMTEYRIRGVIAGMEKRGRKTILAGSPSEEDRERLTDDLPELVSEEDDIFPGNRQQCRPRKDMATCIVGIWLMGVLGVPGEEVITTRGGLNSKLKVAPSLEILKFMGQRDPDKGFWKSWYDKEKKRIEGFPPKEAEATKNVASVLKYAMARGKDNGLDIETDLEFRLNGLPEEEDKVARFFSMLWHRGEHLKAGRAEKKRKMIEEATKDH